MQSYANGTSFVANGGSIVAQSARFIANTSVGEELTTITINATNARITANTTAGNLTTANATSTGTLKVTESGTVGTTLVVTGNTTAGNLITANSVVADSARITANTTGAHFVASGSVVADSARISANTTGNHFIASGSVVADSARIANSLTVGGDLTVSGNTTTINITELNIADNEIVLNTDWPANVYPTQNAGITINRGTVANSPNVFIRWNETADYWVLGANVDEFIIATTANTGAGDITVTNAYQANVGAARIADVASGQANVGAVQIAKVNKSGDVMTGTLTTNSGIIGSSITANNTLTINTNAVYESYTSTTSTTSQFTLDTFSTSTYRSAKYLVQISSGSAYELIELSLIHDGTNVYLSQYGNIKSGSTLGVFDSTISTGVLSLLATPNNAITTFRAVATLITV